MRVDVSLRIVVPQCVAWGKCVTPLQALAHVWRWIVQGWHVLTQSINVVRERGVVSTFDVEIHDVVPIRFVRHNSVCMYDVLTLYVRLKPDVSRGIVIPSAFPTAEPARLHLFIEMGDVSTRHAREFRVLPEVLALPDNVFQAACTLLDTLA